MIPRRKCDFCPPTSTRRGQSASRASLGADAEVPGVTSPLHDHSSYFTPGGESLFSIGDIASGHGDALAHAGMTAPHRGTYWLPNEIDPQSIRPGTFQRISVGTRHLAVVCIVVALIAFTLESCSMAKNVGEGVTHPMTPEQSRAQVVDAARQLVAVLGLKGVAAHFSRESCNDQGEAPFRGVVGLDYNHAPILEASQAEIQRILGILKQHGWSGPGDFHTHAPAVSKQGSPRYSTSTRQSRMPVVGSPSMESAAI